MISIFDMALLNIQYTLTVNIKYTKNIISQNVIYNM